MLTPIYTLESVRTELMVLAQVCGYTDVSVAAIANEYGPSYWAVGHRSDGQTETLANSLRCPTPEAVRREALGALYNQAGTFGASL